MPEPTYTLSVETDIGAYAYGFIISPKLRLARFEAECVYKHTPPRQGTRIISVALYRDGKMFDCYDGGWQSIAEWIDWADEKEKPPMKLYHGTRESFYDAMYEQYPEGMDEALMEKLADWAWDMVSKAYGDGYAQGAADAKQAEEHNEKEQIIRDLAALNWKRNWREIVEVTDLIERAHNLMEKETK